MRMKLSFLAFLALVFCSSLRLQAQRTDQELAPLLTIPRSYTILKTSEPINIDGKMDEQAWAKAAWSEPFEDIEGKPGIKPASLSRFKLLWDNENLYVYCKFEEDHIWATLKEHDQSIFQDNAMEMFIDPDGDTQNYMEFQINAFAAIWDLMLNKAPRNGGPSITDWDIKGLKKAVYIDGTLNNPQDRDKFWGIELAVPLKTFRYGGGNSMPKEGSTWKMNITRVYREFDIKEAAYLKKLGPNGRPAQPAYTCWSVPGIVNFHYPERWGVVRFSEGADSSKQFLNEQEEQLKLMVWKYYYLMQEYKAKNARYPTNLTILASYFPEVNFKDMNRMSLLANNLQFTLLSESAELKLAVLVDHNSKFVVTKLP